MPSLYTYLFGFIKVVIKLFLKGLVFAILAYLAASKENLFEEIF